MSVASIDVRSVSSMEAGAAKTDRKPVNRRHFSWVTESHSPPVNVWHQPRRAVDAGAGSNFRPGTLIPRIRVEIGQPSVKKRAFLRCDGDVPFGEGLPQRPQSAGADRLD